MQKDGNGVSPADGVCKLLEVRVEAVDIQCLYELQSALVKSFNRSVDGANTLVIEDIIKTASPMAKIRADYEKVAFIEKVRRQNFSARRLGIERLRADEDRYQGDIAASKYVAQVRQMELHAVLCGVHISAHHPKFSSRV
eukprot:CAMPEP_0170149948 /NCGR_PEP_ID=MMETSP0033_2-20121228/44748_1 /TAXON_ID=195969 /ORGANISM="Dolichomastix tenuilepis, Strain CCMP3274" /LENGTH=139 /DNA_ID=CAMNT_0010386941 /DNA_START=186 /DNA_END=605 /DNA_ORIENTATION=+